MDVIVIYEHSDIPPGMTCEQYRRLVASERRRAHHPRIRPRPRLHNARP